MRNDSRVHQLTQANDLAHLQEHKALTEALNGALSAVDTLRAEAAAKETHLAEAADVTAELLGRLEVAQAAAASEGAARAAAQAAADGERAKLQARAGCAPRRSRCLMRDA